ncbi:MAG: hypothetical protein WD638_01145 [Nitriliruptoraceae bacterium]
MTEAPANAPLRHHLDAFVSAAAAPYGLVVALTLTTTVTHPPRGASVLTPVLAGVGVVLLPRIQRDRRFWALLTAVTAIGVFSHPLVDLDNHHFLHVYWLLALTLAALARDPAVTLARAGRLLIGGLFLFATLWKVVSPDFTDGSFLTFTLSVDPNVARAPLVLGWQDAELVEANRDALAPLHLDPTSEVAPVPISVTPTVARMAAPLSWLTLVLEAAVALTFLLPLRGAWTRWREASLFAFLLVTYPALPVLSFAALLIAMSLANTDLPAPRAQVLHLGVLLAAGLAGQALRLLAG